VRSRITARRWLFGLISFFLLFPRPSEKRPLEKKLLNFSFG
jgi:hypothetical protein